MDHRNDIDGLRGLAVLAVFIFHLDEAWLSGGYAGVDVFFVLSGYLITRSVTSHGPEFSAATFLSNRFARLVPAASLTALVTAAAASAIFIPCERPQISDAIIANSGWLTNFWYARGSGYFDTPTDTQPLLHYWSLAAEEQFYLLFALVIAVGSRVFRVGPRGALRAAVTLAAISFSLALLEGPNSTRSYYLLHTRSWELLLGVSVALGTRSDPRSILHRYANRAANLGLALLCFSFVLHDRSSGYPGPAAALPALGTVLLIVCTPLAAESPAARLLEARPIRYLGKISYSLYLWHWPIICLFDYTQASQGSAATHGAKITCSLALATLSYHLVENPLRITLRGVRRRKLNLGLTAATIAAQAAVGIAIAKENYTPRSTNPNPLRSALMQITGDNHGEVTGHADYRIALIGDSHAAQYSTRLRGAASAGRFQLLDLSFAGGRLFPGDTALEQAIDDVVRFDPHCIIFATYWSGHLARRDDAEAAVVELGVVLQRHAPRIVLVGGGPVTDVNEPRKALRDRGQRRASVKRGERFRASWLRGLLPETIGVVDPWPLLVDDAGSVRLFDDQGRQIMRDSNHLTEHGAATILPEILEAAAIPSLPPR